jgi:hypothetical protein
VNLYFFPSRISENRQNRQSISIISTMSTPPPSPHLYHEANAGLQTSPDDPSTPSRWSAAPAVPTQLFLSSNKRHSSDDRDGAVSGANSPIKKRVDARSSPQKRADVAVDMDVDSVGFRDFQIDGIEPTSHLNAPAAIARISLSPPTQLPEIEMPAAPSAKPKKKKSAPVQCIDTSDSRVFPFVRDSVFDSDRFVKANETVYSVEEMKKYDAEFQKQLNFNFSQRRGVYKKHLSEARVSRSQAIDELDLNSSAFSGESSNFQELSNLDITSAERVRSGMNIIQTPRSRTPTIRITCDFPSPVRYTASTALGLSGSNIKRIIFCCIGLSSSVSQTAAEQAVIMTSSMSDGPSGGGEGGGDRDASDSAAAAVERFMLWRY